MAYAQFEELEAFARFATRLDDATRRTLARGQRVREIFKLPQYEPVPVAEQIAVWLAVVEGVFDDLPIEALVDAQARARRAVVEQLGEVCEWIEEGGELGDVDRRRIARVARAAVTGQPPEDNADHADA